MPLPSKRFLTVPDAVNLLSSTFDEECLAETIWDYIINQRLHICVLINSFPLTAYAKKPSKDSQLTNPENDLEQLATLDCVCYINPREIPTEYCPWFRYFTIMTFPGDKNTICESGFDEGRFCMIDIEVANYETEFGGAPSQVFNNYDMAFVTKEEIDRFININLETQEEIKEVEQFVSVKEKRELILKGWVAGKKFASEDLINMAFTHKELWKVLGIIDPKVFPPSSSDTIKDFFAAQTIIKSFKKGRRKGGN